MPDVTSAGEAFGEREALEARYGRIVGEEVRGFFDEVEGAALAGLLTALLVFGAWARALERMEARGAVTAAADLRESEVPGRVLVAAQQAAADAVGAGLSAAERATALRTALGLVTDPEKGSGGAFGRILGPDGAYSWTGASDMAARTASTADFGASMLEQARAEGYTHKRWMTRYDSRVRDTHAAVDRVTITLDETFSVGAARMRFPADPLSGDIAEVANCRCVLALVRFGQRELDHPEGTTPWDNPRPL